MTFTQAIASGFSNYVTFSGRAASSAYWYWALFVFVVAMVAGGFDTAFFPDSESYPFGNAWGLITLLPGLAVSVRRLHDIDRTGWWVLIAFTILGIALLIYWACQKGTSGPNRFGADPLA